MTRLRRFALSPVTAFALALAGCGGPAPSAPAPGASTPNANAPEASPQASPTAAPSFSPYNPKLASDDAKAGVSDAGIKVLGGALTVETTDGTNAIAKAVVDVYGPTLATGITGTDGKAALGSLEPGATYTVVVHAPGFAAVKQEKLEIKQKMTTSVRLAMVPGAILSGRVTANGQPVGGAVVSDGLTSTITDAQGQYQLPEVATGNVTLRASKPGFKAGVHALPIAGNAQSGVDLNLSPAEGSLFFDTRLVKNLDTSKFTTLKAAFTAQHWKLIDTPPPSPGDVWVLVCPGRTPSADTIAQATAFVAQGGKLILLGEWGGFSGFNNPGANAIGHAIGLHFNPDAVREFDNGTLGTALTIRKLEPLVFGTDGPASLVLTNACSVFGLSAMRPLATTGPKAFHVQAGETETRTIAIGGPFGAGKAIAVGDTSGFSDDDGDGDGTPDAKAADNMGFWSKLLAW